MQAFSEVRILFTTFVYNARVFKIFYRNEVMEIQTDCVRIFSNFFACNLTVNNVNKLSGIGNYKYTSMFNLCMKSYYNRIDDQHLVDQE